MCINIIKQVPHVLQADWPAAAERGNVQPPDSDGTQQDSGGVGPKSLIRNNY